MEKVFLLFAGFLIVTACGNKNKEKDEVGVMVVYFSSPAGMQSAEPYLFTDKNGAAYLSWMEEKDSISKFRFSKLNANEWSEPSLIAQGNTWFVNWADYPMIATDGAGNLISHWLDKSGESTYAYDIKMSASADGGKNWNAPFVLHDDGTQSEHGFVTILPYHDNFFVVWLDGRNTAMENIDGMEGSEEGGHHAHPDGPGAMSLRAAIIDHAGNKIDEWELDDKTCDCCQTTAVITDNGPVVFYRDRSDEEIRDISVVRLVEGNWTKPRTVFNDNWKINACPVNGPRATAIGNTVAMAWYTVPDGKAQVNVIFSTDGGASFGKPVRISEGDPIGRVDIVMLDENSAMVSWMEDSAVKAVKVYQDGSKGTPVTIATSSTSRASGFPQMTKSGDNLIFAWTDDQEEKVKVARLELN